MRAVRALALAAGLLIVTAATTKGWAQSASQFIDRTAQEVMDVVDAPDIDAAEQYSRFSDVIARSVDVELVGRIAIGRYWKQMTPAQRANYREQFRRHVTSIYLQRFGEHTGAKFRVLDELRTTRTDALVSAKIIGPRGLGLESVFRVRESTRGYRIVDVIVDGASLVLTKRAEFGSLIHHKGIDELLRTLAETSPEHRNPEWLLETF